MGTSVSNNRNAYQLSLAQYSMKGNAKLFAYNQNRRQLIIVNQQDRLIIRRSANGQITKTSNCFRKKRKIVQDVNEGYIEKSLGKYLSWIRQSSIALFISTRANKIIRNCTKIYAHPTKQGPDLILIYKTRYLTWDPFTGKLDVIGAIIDHISYKIALYDYEAADQYHYQLGTGDCITGLYYNGLKQIMGGCCVALDAQPISVFGYSPNGKLLLIIYFSQVIVKDAFTLKQLWSCSSRQLKSARFSQDNKFLMVIKEKKVNIHLSMTGEKVYTIQNLKQQEISEQYILLGEIGKNRIGVLKLKDTTKVH